MLIKLFRALGHLGFVAALVFPATETRAQLALASQIVPGWLDLIITQDGSSSLDLELSQLETDLCGYTAPNGSSGGSEECRIVFGAGGRLSGSFATSPLRIQVLSSAAGPGGSTLLTVRPSSLMISYPESFGAPCDDFSYVLSLAAGTQPTSVLTLLAPTSGSGATGLMVGSLQLLAAVSFTPVGVLEDVEPTHNELLNLNLDFGGRWTVLSPSHPAFSNLVGQGSTNLTLFADRATPASWAARPACGQDKQKCSRFCLEASEERLDFLNATNGGELGSPGS